MAKIQGCLFLIVTILVLGAVGAFLGKRWYDDAIFSKDSENLTNIDVVVNEGESISDVSKKLEDAGLIKSSQAVRIYIKLEKLNPNIKPGEYSIPSDLNVPEIIEILEKGILKPYVAVTLKEGLRDDQIADELEKAFASSDDTVAFSKTEFLEITERPENYTFSPEIQTFLQTYKPQYLSLSGFLYPDTYRFDHDQTSMQVVETLVDNFITKVNAEIDLANLNLTQSEVTNLYDAMILGSVIEKEASAIDDRADISSVFHNRLSIGMPLQSDATIVFITRKTDDIVLFTDLEIDSPYNTYLYAGLPPTPINNSRVDSIKAAFYPNTTNYYYFLYIGNGVTLYSETFEEHNQKTQQYRGDI